MKNSKVDIDKLNREIFLITHGHPELLDEFLKDAGYDPSKLESNGVSKVKALLFKTKVALNKQKQENLYSRALAVFKSTKEDTKDAILSLLRQRAPQLQFNNLEKMDESDLKEILDESDLLDLMNKIEKDDFQ